MDRAAHKKRCSPNSSTSSSTSTSQWSQPTDDSTPTTTSTSAAATYTPQGSSGGGGDKCGLGWPNGNDGTIMSCAGDCSWYHTWSVYPVSAGSQLQFAAYFWGPDMADEWDANILNAGTNVAMFFNEPQEPGQSNVDPYTSVGYWRQHMQYLKDQYGYRLGSAATSSNPNGIDWTNEFMQACPDCTIDFMCLHWYGTTVSDFQTYVELWYTTYNRNIWISEFACQNFVNLDQQCDDVPGFMSQAVAWLDSQDYVEHHAWFGMMRDMQGVNPADGLMNQDGSLSALGSQYVYS
ncbi:glycoside hydrolase family 128 protein [Calocera viscosa TUFC12733]|uniref:Glycoside hydrolase family 128 protein n=1 Tax=Calocera viscosa (strain TUFC12733) TaxID=1330018 RepID=A0A167J5K3_CALVF|nr:glycoside hydrolase family 128 protein [Calocera viscosa TUFC12733]